MGWQLKDEKLKWGKERGEEIQGKNPEHVKKMEVWDSKNKDPEMVRLQSHGQNLHLYSTCNWSYVENEMQV